MSSAEAFFRARVGAQIGHGFAADAVREALDLAGASEVWGGPAFDARPAWYLWLGNARGGYRLRLETAADDGGLLRGSFSVKYYPSPLEPVFARFSAEERRLVENGAFDDTGTPRFATHDQVPETLFNVGVVEMLHAPDGGAAVLRFTGLDPMRFRDADAAGGARELPAWDLGHALFDVLAGLESFLARRPPQRVIVACQPGFEMPPADDPDAHTADCDHCLFKSISVVFAGDAGAAAVSGAVDEVCRPPWRVLHDAWARPLAGVCCHGHAEHEHDHAACGGHGRRPGPFMHRVTVGDTPWEVPLAFNAAWWTLAETAAAAAVLPCGCH